MTPNLISASDFATLNAAVTAAVEAGYDGVYIPANFTTLATSTISLPSHFSIIGENPVTSAVRLTSTSAADGLTARKATDLTFQNFTISSAATDQVNNTSLIKVADGSNVTVQGLTFLDAPGRSLFLNEVTDSVVTENHTAYGHFSQIVVYGSNNTITHNDINGGQWYGIDARGEGFVISDNHIQRLTGDHSFGIAFQNLANSVIKDNLIENVEHYGMYTDGYGTHDTAVINNTVRAIGIVDGVRLDEAGTAIQVRGGAHDLLIANNKLPGELGYGVAVAGLGFSAGGLPKGADAPNVIISGNIITDQWDPGIVVSGTSHATVRDNYVSSKHSMALSIGDEHTDKASGTTHSDYALITNNTFTANWLEGIWATGVSHSVIMGNTITDNITKANWQYHEKAGITLMSWPKNGDSVDNTIIGNVITSNTKYEKAGVFLSSGEGGNTIAFNDLTTNPTAVQDSSGTGTNVVANNKTTAGGTELNGAPPIADAGTAQLAASGQTVLLDASGSHLMVGTGSISYHWVQIYGTHVSIENADSMVASFTAPGGSQLELYGFHLVTSNANGSTFDEVYVAVDPSLKPVVAAPPPPAPETTGTAEPPPAETPPPAESQPDTTGSTPPASEPAPSETTPPAETQPETTGSTPPATEPSQPEATPPAEPPAETQPETTGSTPPASEPAQPEATPPAETQPETTGSAPPAEPPAETPPQTAEAPADPAPEPVDPYAGLNPVTGGAGNEVLAATAAADKINGGAGSDTATYAASDAAVNVSLATGTGAGGSAEGDVLLNIENLTGSAFADTLEGDGGNNTLDGGAGNDTVSYEHATAGVTVNLAKTTVQDTGGAGLDKLSGFENVTGSNYGDHLIGTVAGNALNGLDGNDTLDGAAGADTMAGGTGDDLYVVDNFGDVVIENAGEGHDTVRSSVAYTLGDNIEDLILTGTGALKGTGNALDNAITGNSGNNILAGLAGADTMDGGAGVDTATYAASSAGVDVSLATGLGHGGDAEGDVLLNIENLKGSAFNDTLEGDDGDNVLIGGAGIDTVSYAHASAGVTVSLATTAAQNTIGAGTDKLCGFENLTGSAFDDLLQGSGAANLLLGGAGNDTLDGGSGNDTLNGGSGADVLIGGMGNDTFLFRMGEANGDTILDFAGKGALAGDLLVFEGYGAGATLTNAGGELWDIHFAGGTETITITGPVHANDYLFI